MAAPRVAAVASVGVGPKRCALTRPMSSSFRTVLAAACTQVHTSTRTQSSLMPRRMLQLLDLRLLLLDRFDEERRHVFVVHGLRLTLELPAESNGRQLGQKGMHLFGDETHPRARMI